MTHHDRRSLRRWSWRLRWWPWARRALLDIAAEDWRLEQEAIDRARVRIAAAQNGDSTADRRT